MLGIEQTVQVLDNLDGVPGGGIGTDRQTRFSPGCDRLGNDRTLKLTNPTTFPIDNLEIAPGIGPAISPVCNKKAGGGGL